MKTLLTTLFSCGLLIISCHNSLDPVSNSQDKKAEATSASSPDPYRKGYGSFIFTMNGKQRTFTTWHQFILFPLNNSTEVLMLEDGGPGGPGFNFKINKTGSTKFEAGYSNTLVPELLFTFFDTTGVSYMGDDMVVNVTSLSATRLTGTFIGKFVKGKYQVKENKSPDILQVFEVTDGKFELHTNKESN